MDNYLGVLRADFVNDLFYTCVQWFDESVPREDAKKLIEEYLATGTHIRVDGVMASFIIIKEKLEENRDKIKTFITMLPDSFKKGDSFLCMCVTKTGEQWGEHRNMEQLIVLGIAAGYMEYVFPRELWHGLPGGMPYIIVKLEEKNDNKRIRDTEVS